MLFIHVECSMLPQQLIEANSGTVRRRQTQVEIVPDGDLTMGSLDTYSE